MTGTIVRGRGVAGGGAASCWYPGGSISRQLCGFRMIHPLALPWGSLHRGTINVELDEAELFIPVVPLTVKVEWFPGIREWFILGPTPLFIQDDEGMWQEHPACLYLPSPAGKTSAPSVEFLAPYLPDATHGRKIAVPAEQFVPATVPSAIHWATEHGLVSERLSRDGAVWRLLNDPGLNPSLARLTAERVLADLDAPSAFRRQAHVVLHGCEC